MTWLHLDCHEYAAYRYCKVLNIHKFHFECKTSSSEETGDIHALNCN